MWRLVDLEQGTVLDGCGQSYLGAQWVLWKVPTPSLSLFADAAKFLALCLCLTSICSCLQAQA